MRRDASRIAALLVCTALTPAAAAQAQGTPLVWKIDNTLGLEWLGARGDRLAASYGAEGFGLFDDAAFMAGRRVGAYEVWQATGSASFLDALSRGEDGLIIPQFSFKWQKGDASVPFRVTAGDYIAFQTARTIRRAQKGVLMELQPQWNDGLQHSIQAFAGYVAPFWNDLDIQDDAAYGLSWAVQGKTWASGLHLSHRRDAFGFDGGADRTTLSVPLTWTFELWQGAARLEAELAQSWRSDGRDGRMGFASLTGRSADQRTNWSVLIERVDEDYLAAAATLSPHAERAVASLTHRFEDGRQLSATLRHDRFQPGTVAVMHQTTAALSLTGRLMTLRGIDIAGTLGGSYRLTEYRSFADEEAAGIDLDVGAALGERWRLRLTAKTEFATSARAPDEQWNYVVGLTPEYSFAIDGVKGAVGAGITFQDFGFGGQRYNDVAPNLYVRAQGERWSANLVYRQSWRAVDGLAFPDVVSDQLLGEMALSVFGSDRLALRVESFARDFESGQQGRAGRVTLSWTRSFQPDTEPATSAISTAPLAAGPDRSFALDALLSARDTGETLLQAAERGWQAPRDAGGCLVWEEDVLALTAGGVRQRVVVDPAGAAPRAASLVFDTTGASDAATVFEEVFAALVAIYGTPDRVERDAEGSPVAEWRLSHATLRLGTPPDADPGRRIEAWLARVQPSAVALLWGLSAAL